MTIAAWLTVLHGVYVMCEMTQSGRENITQ